MRRSVGLLAVGTVLALAVRVLYLFGSYILGAGGAQRFHVETWALIFVALGLIVRLARSTGRADDPPPNGLPPWAWVLYCSVALALYFPALSVGLLSDDYVLVAHAADWNIGPVTAALFRPIPLLGWAILLHAGAGATTLHALNIVLHGTNAFLTARIVAGLGTGLPWAVFAGLLMVAAPLAPEAVVWLSGVFDLSSTALVLLAILIARKYNARPSAATRAQLVVVGLAAVGSKETAAVAALLVLVDAWARRKLSRELWLDCGILLGIVGLFAVVRLATAFGTSMPPLSRYLAQRALFGSFGALAVPWHVDVIERLPWAPLAGGAAVVALAAAFFVDPAGSRRRTRQAVAGAVCALLPIVPIFPILYIAPDLQQSRYLYMSGFGWAALVAVAASERARSLVSFAAVSVLVALGAYGTTLHLRPWNAAALLRDRVEMSARQAGMERCEAVVVGNLPDSVDGAYVFRNGGAEAFARDLQLDVTLAEEGAGPCSFRWNEARLSFVGSAGE